jgi:hypothetical protein
MSLRFIAKDPDSPSGGSPTIYADDETGDYVLQGWVVSNDEALSHIGPVPEGETLIRFPARMINLLEGAHSGTRTNG